jgi:hypothetical protein
MLTKTARHDIMNTLKNPADVEAVPESGYWNRRTEWES